jgi:hypothetical protein
MNLNLELAPKAGLRIRIQDPGSGAFLTPGSRIRDPGSGMGKKSRSGSGIRDEDPGSYFRELRNKFWVKMLKLLDADQDPGSGVEKFEPGIRDKHHGSST